jgi:hypothetical protein
VALTDILGHTTGIPVSIGNATAVTAASFTLTYDPTLLTIASTGALSLSSLATTAGLTVLDYSITNVDAHHNTLTVSLSGGTGLTTSSQTPLVTITASVPATAPYLNKALLNLGNVVVNGASAAGVSGVDEAAYLGDVSGGGSVNALGASLVDQVGSGAGTGFSSYKDLDPAIIGAVSGGEFVSATDASLINEAGSGATIVQIPPIPSGVTLTFGGPDPYLYLSAVQGAAGQTVTETLYLDVTDPNGIQLTALDEAIGFDASELRISNVRGAAALAGLGSYATASTADNGSGVLLVGQAFAGSGLPPVVPYGTVMAVLQFDVTLNTDVPVGSVAGLTLLQDGTINGQTKYTAISDNEGALMWTPGRAPSNSGNASVDGSVTVVAVTIPVEQESSSPVVTPPKVVAPVKRVPPARIPIATPVTSIVVVDPPVIVETTTSAEVAESVNASPLVPSLPTVAQPEASVTTTSVPASTDSAVTTILTPSTARSTDSGASLSVAAVGANRVVPVMSTGMSSPKASTTVLDELYRQLGTTLVGPSENNGDLGASGDSAIEEMPDVWDLEAILVEMDFGAKSDDGGRE